jgi:hypothetical protein
MKLSGLVKKISKRRRRRRRRRMGDDLELIVVLH